MKVAFNKATVAVFLYLVSTSGCYHTNEFLYHDSWIQMHEYEIVSLLQNKNNRKTKKTSNVDSLRMTDKIADPEEPHILEDKIVSINVTEETPIVDVIMELARMSGTNIQIDPTIVGGVNLNLRDKPLRQVFNSICRLTDTRYDEKYGDIIVFQRDMPYAKTYNIDFLDVARDVASSITLNTSGLSSASVASGGTSTVTTKSQDSFWDDIIKDVSQIVQTTENTNKIYTTTAEKIQKIAKNEEEENKLQEDINNGVYNKNINENHRQKTNNTNNQSNSKESNVSDDRIRANRRAGIITITASTKSHRAIDTYLQQLKKKYSAQVLIEMRMLEIELKKEYQAGIDWANIGSLGGKMGNILNTSSSLGTIGVTSGFTSFIFNNQSLDATAKLFEQFGSTRTLSNPRINAMNNQPALMTFAENYVYFKTKSTYTPATYGTNSTGGTSVLTQGYRNIESESQTMPLGVIMSVLPSIDVDKREIILNIKPTISKKTGTVKDPAITILDKESSTASAVAGASTNDDTTQNEIPIASVRELDTILKLKDGQTAVIGGFTERNAEITDNGIPILRSIPLIGNLFTNKQSSTTAKETIILVKATIVENGKKMSEYEKGVYDAMSDDPRMNEI